MIQALHIIGINVRMLREAKGWTQDDLANRLGVSHAKVSGLERAARGVRVSDAELKRIASVFLIDPSRMLKRLPAPGALGPFKGRGNQGSEKKPEAVTEFLRKVEKPVETDHANCTPDNLESLCAECRVEWDAVEMEAKHG